MKWRLFLDMDAIEYLASLPAADEARIRRRLHEIERSPDRWSDFHDHDPKGRLVDVNLVGSFAIEYWADFPDRHVKVLRIRHADRSV